MRVFFVIGILLVGSGGASQAEAKTLTLDRGAISPPQLQDELLTAFPAWHGMPLVEGGWSDPLIAMSATKTTITLTVPDDADEVAINAIVSAHVPTISPDPAVVEQNRLALLASAKTKLIAGTPLTEAEAQAVVE